MTFSKTVFPSVFGVCIKFSAMLDHQKLGFPVSKMSAVPFDDLTEDSSSSGHYAQIQDYSSSSALSNTSFEVLDPLPMANSGSSNSSEKVFPILRPDLGWIRSIDDYENGEIVRKTRRKMAAAAAAGRMRSEEVEMIPRPKWSNRRVTFGKMHVSFF